MTGTAYEITDADLRWATGYAKRYAFNLPHLADELESAAGLGLAQAARSYDPETHGTKFRTHAAARVVGAIKDALREEMPKGYGRHWAARYDIADTPRTESIHAIAVDDNGNTLDRAIPSGELPVGWEAEYQDEVRGLARRLPASLQPPFRAFFGRADGLRMKQAAELAGISVSRVSQSIDAAGRYLSERFTDPNEVFMTGTNRISETAFEPKNGTHDAPQVKTCKDCNKPCHPANGRCYDCRPGGAGKRPVVIDSPPRTSDLYRPAAPAPSPPAVRVHREPAPVQPRPVPSAAPPINADALSVVLDAIEALERLDADAFRRVVAFVGKRKNIA